MLEPLEPLEPMDVITFWRDAGNAKWFSKDAAFDAEIKSRFGEAVAAARDGQLDAWRANAEGALALLLLLDQFTRNIFRDQPAMFAADGQARALAAHALAQNWDDILDGTMRRWFYMPFMHSEELADQERCVALCRRAQLQETIPYAEEHAAIIRRFGRFPHRNTILGRASTAEEARFLADGGFSG